MPREALPRLLEQLHQELEGGTDVDSSTTELLQQVSDDIRAILARPAAEIGDEHHTLIERLRETTWSLEESHPKITTTVGQIAEALRGIFS